MMSSYGREARNDQSNRVLYNVSRLSVNHLSNLMHDVISLSDTSCDKGSLTIAMGKCLWFSVK